MGLAELCICLVRTTHFRVTKLTQVLHDSEVFVIVSLTLFLPICLEQFARCAMNTSSTHRYSH